MRYVTQCVLAALLALAASAASAMPVQVSRTSVEWYFDEYAGINGVAIVIGDCRIRCTDFEEGHNIVLGTSSAPVISRSHMYLETTTRQGANYTEFDVHAHLEAFASVHRSLQGGFAMSMAQLATFRTAFQVFEPVLFTGSFGLYEGSPEFEPPNYPPTFTSGSILQPGLYSTMIGFDRLSTSVVHSGSEKLQQDLNFGYYFTEVPAPGALVLFAFGLLGMCVAKRAGRTKH